MNQVFITCPVGHAGKGEGRPDIGDLGVIACYVAASTLGGVTVAIVLNRLGNALRWLDPSSNDIGLVVVAAATMVPVLVLQLTGRIDPLPQRHQQVPRRWLGWRRRSLTAAAFGLMLGAGALTHLRYAVMYVLAIATLAAPSPWMAACVGAVYGASRGAMLFYTWSLRSLDLRVTPGLGRASDVILTASGAVVALVFGLSIIS
jgi:hypothetical protein